MNKTDFIEQLKRRLSKLPNEEVTNVIAYYEEYFNEAGEGNEQKVIDELGTPDNIASQIIANFAIKDTENSTKKGLYNVWMVILAIFASPIALPLALAVVAVVFSFIIVILSCIFAIGVTGFALCIAGIISAVSSIALVFQDFATAMFFIGLGLLSLGLGLMFVIFTTVLSKKSFGWITKKMSKFILRRSKQNDKE